MKKTYKMRTVKNGKTALYDCTSGRIYVFDNLRSALEFLWLMKELYHIPKCCRIQVSYPDRSLTNSRHQPDLDTF